MFPLANIHIAKLNKPKPNTEAKASLKFIRGKESLPHTDNEKIISCIIMANLTYSLYNMTK